MLIIYQIYLDQLNTKITYIKYNNDQTEEYTKTFDVRGLYV